MGHFGWTQDFLKYPVYIAKRPTQLSVSLEKFVPVMPYTLVAYCTPLK